MSYNECPCCGAPLDQSKVVKGQVLSCTKCGALFGDCYLGESFEYVKPQMTGAKVAVERYFDFTCVGSKGIERRHGWFDPNTKLITQIG